MTTLFVLLAGLILLGVAVTIASLRSNRRRKREAVLLARLESLQVSRAGGFELPQVSKQDWLESGPEFLQVWLNRADVRVGGRTVILYILVLAAIALVIWRLFGPGWATGALLLGALAPIVTLHRLASHRAAKFTEALPYFLDGLRQLLTVGQSFQQALIRATDEAAPVVRSYLGPATRRIRNGASMPDAISLAADRVAIPELHMLSAAVRMNLRFGGSIGPTLADLATMLRSRARIGREIGAATSETRASAMILCALPFAAVILLFFVQPDYISFLWRTETGQRMLMVAAAFQITGMLIMRRLARIDF